MKLFFPHALLADGWARDVGLDVADGRVAAVQRGCDGAGRERVSGIALPGLPNLHSHAFQRGMAGLTEVRGPEGDNFWSWRQLMYRFLSEITPDDVESLAAQAYMEMLESGFTAVGEFHYLHHGPDGRPYANLAEMAERIAAAAAETGIGLTLLPTLYAHSSFGGAPPTEGQRRFLNDASRFARLLEASQAALKDVPDAACGVAPHSLRAVSPELLREALAVARGPVHMHVAEQVKEVEDCVAWSGARPVEWLLAHADVNARWCLIHATHMTDRETTALAATGAVVSLCPITEANLGDGIFNGVTYNSAGGRFGVGTDSNVEISAPGELKQLEYSQRLGQRVRNALGRQKGQSSGRLLFDAAASAGTQPLARAIGALAPGLRADIVVLRNDLPEMAGVSGDRWIDQFVFAYGARAIDRVYAGGRLVVENGRHVHRTAVVERFARTFARLASA
jgi:formimidoylglutamate deiminase